MKWIFALVLALAASAQTFQWKANPEPDMAGYRLFVYGPTNFVLNIPHPTVTQTISMLPAGAYSALLTAYNTELVESDPAGPLFWTNSNMITLVFDLQRSPTLTGEWVRILSLTNTEPKTNQQFYRLEIR